MPLPDALRLIPDETTVVGDLAALVPYIESGQAWQDWAALCQRSQRELEEIFPPLSLCVITERRVSSLCFRLPRW